MINPFAIEKSVLQKIAQFEVIVEAVKRQISQILLLKSQQLGLQLTQDLKDKCEAYIQSSSSSKRYLCKICNKQFDDGRKLGGHVSRAHKDLMLADQQQFEKSKGKKRVKIEESSQPYEEESSGLSGYERYNIKKQLEEVYSDE